MNIHFLSGLPRSGSTLLGSILSQNPIISTGISTPLAEICSAALRTMSSAERAQVITDEQRGAILTGIITNYYSHLGHTVTAIDKNREWCQMLPALARLYPQSKVICCIRNPAWILDSIERLTQNNSLLQSKMFPPDINDVYQRAEYLFKTGLIGSSMRALRQAWFSENADRLVAVPYEALVASPERVLGRLYDALGWPPFAHRFDGLSHDEPEFDGRLFMPGLHKIRDRIDNVARRTILPPEIFAQYNMEFWNGSEDNPRNVLIV